MMKARGLTSGERAMISRLFGETLDPAPVRLHQRRWWPLQPVGIVMAPDGHLWFPPGNPGWRDDFAAASLPVQAFFLHEMTHIWQYQTGLNLILARGPFARYAYLPLRSGWPFERYGIEQQAEIVRHYWLLKQGALVSGAPPLAAYEALLPFLPPDQRHATSLVTT
jgi:hypothetical protein